MSPAYERLKGRIGRLQRQCAVNDVAAAGLAAAGLAGLGLAVVAALFWSGWVLAALVVPMVWLAVRWRRDFAVAGVARQAEDQLAEVRGRLTVALELGRYEPESRERYSAELLDAAVAQVEAQVAGLPLAGVVRRSRLAWAGLVCVAGAAALAGLWLAGPVRAGIGLVNAFRPGAVPVAFRVEPGDTAVLPGGVVVVRCRVEPAGVFTWVRLELRGQAREPRRLRLDGDTCRVPLNVHEDLRYRFRVLGRWSVEHRVRLLEPLVAERLAFTYRYPPHTGLAESRSPGTDLSAPRGTRVLFEGRANHALSSGRLVLGADTVVAAIDLEDSARFSGEFGLVADCDGRVELSEGGAFQAVAGLHVHAVADEPPFVKLFMPGRDVDLPQEMQVLLGVNSIDDYGLGSLYLCSGRESLDQRLRLKGLDGRREDTTLYVWDLSGSGLLPGEELRYWVEVSDNDAVSGPKTSRSEVFSVRFPTMAELFDAAVNQTERTASQLGALPAHQSALSSELARVSDELKRSRELPWEERRRLEQILQEQERLAGRVDHLSREVSETAQELMQGITLDPETMQELGQLQSLLAQLLPPELQQALQHLRERLQQDSPQLGPAMEQMQIAQEKLQEGIDRALELLKRIMQEQRLEALACKAEELAEAQERLTAEMRQQPGEQLAQKQEDIRQGLDSLQWVMEELAREFRESDSGPGSEADVGDSLAALNEQLEQDQASERAEQLAQQMSSGQVQSAQQRQSRELSGQFRQVAQSLAQLSQELKERRSAQVGQKLAASAADLLMLSEQQERLEQAAGSMADPAGSAGQQQALQEGTRIAAESLAALAGRTMVTSPELGQALALAMQSMQDAAGNLALNRAAAAARAMAQARRQLNSAAGSLLNSLSRAQQGGGMMGGMESLLESLRQMAAQQMSINAGMSGIPIPIPVPGGLTQAQMQQLARLMAQQQALREQLQQMLQNMGGQRPGLTASLDRLLEEMQAVERDMAELNVDRQLVERQQSIAAHLLDAERSMRQQGFREERQSETGRAFELGSRPQMPQDRGERNRLLREELMRALKQGYPPEYEQMIRAYFDRLLNAP